jgi:hypothetical protein
MTKLDQPGYWKKNLSTPIACFFSGKRAALAGYVVSIVVNLLYCQVVLIGPYPDKDRHNWGGFGTFFKLERIYS